MKPRRNSKSEENRAAAASLLVDLEEEFSPKIGLPDDLADGIREIPFKPTEKRLETYGKSTDNRPFEPTENLRKMVAAETMRMLKPTEKPTDLVRKTYGKPTDLWSLVGFQRQAFFALAKQAKELGFSDDAGNRITPPINGNIFAQQHLKKPYKRAKDVLYELKVAGFLTVYKVKNGRGGFVQFLIQKTHYQSFLLGESLEKPTENGLETYGKPTGKPTDKPTENILCSSSNLNINNTTTTEPDLWLSVPKNLEGRVSIRQLRDFVKQNLISAEDLQSSLDGFAYDLEKGSIRAKNGNPVAILIGAVKSGGYISQSYLSELKASLADVEKARLEMQQIQAANSTQQLQEEFESFRAKFPDQAEQLKPMSKYLTNFELGSVGYKMWLEEYKKSLNAQPNLEAAEAQL